MTVFESDNYLAPLKQKLEVFVPSTVSDAIKPKRELAIKKAYNGVYDIQCAAASIINDIGVSHLLAMNEVVVPHLVEEYAKLNFVLRKLDAALKAMNPFSEVSQATEEIKKSLQLKDIGKHLYQDLETLSERFAVEVEIKPLVESIKTYQAPKSLLLQMGITA